MSVASFVSDALPDARIASAKTGVPVSVILAQWGIETAWGSSKAFVEGHNYAGIMTAGHLRSYPDRATGLADYISVLNERNYTAVRSAGSSSAAASALGKSPWDAGHYQEGGGPAGTSLLAAISANNLTRYDTGDVVPPAGGIDPGIVGNNGSATPSSGGGVTATPVFNPLSPGDWLDTLKKVGLYVVLIGGGVTLVALGMYRGVAPIQRKVDETKANIGQGAALAAMA